MEDIKQLTILLVHQDIDAFYTWSNEGIELAKILSLPIQQKVLERNLYQYYINKNEYETALATLFNSSIFFKNQKLDNDFNLCIGMMADVQSYMNKPDEAIIHYLEFLKYNKKNW